MEKEPPSHPPRRAPRRPLPALGAAALLLLGLSGSGLEEESESLRRRAELAGQEAVHAVLDLSVPRLRLMYGGAVLRDYEISRVELGEPAIAFLPAPSSAEWRNRIMELDAMKPRRHHRRELIEAPEPGGPPPVPVVPPDPEQAIPAPPRYLLRLKGGVSIEIAREDGTLPSAWDRLISRARMKLLDLGDIVLRPRSARLRLVMPAGESDALYRSLPAETKMLVVL